MTDPKENSEFLYVRRPNYYFSYMGGTQREQQRLGPASVWHPTVGTIIWSSRLDRPDQG
ncbi:MAG TPA: hypothetical protein GXX57_04515 [Firmicutes bacterium]|nr:hypothetical protein [Bacillota bacterium]